VKTNDYLLLIQKENSNESVNGHHNEIYLDSDVEQWKGY
jgi:hypothetical protein